MQILRISSPPVKICQIPHVIFATTSRFYLKFCITDHCLDTKLLSNFLTNSWYASDTSTPSKCKFWHFPVLAWKFPKFVMSFLQQQVDSFWNLASLFSTSTHNSSVIFKLIFYICTLDKRSPRKCQFQVFSALSWKCIPHTIFARTRRFFFKFYIFVQCNETYHLFNFLTHSLYTLDISTPSKCKFWNFPVLAWKFFKFLMSVLQEQVDSFWNSASLFSASTHNSSLIF